LPAAACTASTCGGAKRAAPPSPTLTIGASQTVGLVRGLLMRPFLKKLFYGINFTPFIEEAERREKASKIQADPA
jgi:hypothetical protein